MKFINDSVESCVEDYAKETKRARDRLISRLTVLKTLFSKRVENTQSAIDDLTVVKKESENTLAKVNEQLFEIEAGEAK